jgi:hypothetical protein
MQPGALVALTKDQTANSVVLDHVELATELADDAARSELELYCASVRLGNGFYWYDTTRPIGAGIPADIARARRYLELRGHVIVHPQQHDLVRFGQ